ncbi:hypothetical protein C9F11_31555 [Streptomyces sp. YIM 121038]|nr:hypothetical protein C9F11_31555 [Streptomyces sp. YIM 121038]
MINFACAKESKGAADPSGENLGRMSGAGERGTVRITSHSTSLGQPTSADIPAYAVTVSVD